MRFLGVGGGLVAASVLIASAAPAQTLLDRPLWQFLEPEAAATSNAPESRLHLAKSYGPSGGTSVDGTAAANGELSDSEYGSLGCIIGGTVGTVAAAIISGPNVVNMIAGGIVPAATPAAMYTGLVGVVFATFCAVGQAVTPAALLAYRNLTAKFADEPPPVPAPAVPREDPPPPLLGRLIKVSAEMPQPAIYR